MAKAFRYEQEVKHTNLNKVRIVQGTDPHIVAQRAKELLASWDKLWEEHLIKTAQQFIRAKNMTSRQDKKDLAAEITREAKASIEALKSILKSALPIDNRINWEQCKDYSEFFSQIAPFNKPKPSYNLLPFDKPKPSYNSLPFNKFTPLPPIPPPAEAYIPPKPKLSNTSMAEPLKIDSKYHPKFGLIDRLIPGAKQKKLNEAALLYEEDRQKWQSQKEEANKTNEPLLKWYEQSIAHYQEVHNQLLREYAEAEERYKQELADWQTECCQYEESQQIEYKQELAIWQAEYYHYEQSVKIQYNACLADWQAEYSEYRQAVETEQANYIKQQEEVNSLIDQQKADYYRLQPSAIIDYCYMVLSNSLYPDDFSKEFELDYIPDSKLLIIEYSLPAIETLPNIKEVKYIQTRDEFSEVNLSETELSKIYDNLLYEITLRTIHELYQADVAESLATIVFNGWIRFIDRATGNEENACILSLQAGRDEFLTINLANVDPKTCFKSMKGVGSSKLHSLTPVAPIVQMDKEDKRFVASYAVVDTIAEGVNLAAMEWEDFEHLIREIFEKEFAQSGGEVKVTQASRDGGVDAIAFDPDPIRGGKIVIQAKRYTNVVGVSAVRDLYGTLMNEGATKGILVTTADFGPDSYDFAKGKPLTLLNGGNLLHLLQKHGHNARIDLKEAKKIIAERVNK